MNARICILAVVALALTASSAPDRPATQPRAKADLVVVGTIHDLTFTRHTVDRDGACIRGLAEVIVTAVERGEGAWIGEKLNIRWTVVVRRPGRPEGEVSNHLYRMKADDIVRFWLMKDGKNWTIIDNPDGVENLTAR